VKAFLCDSTNCNNLKSSTTYYMTRSGNIDNGGYQFTTDAYSRGPNDLKDWLNADAFGSGIGTNAGPYIWTTRGTVSPNVS